MSIQLTRGLALLVIFQLGNAVNCRAQEEAIPVTVEIENVAPENGVAITPVWVGFHSGSFDSYNGGLAALPGLERVAEDGNTSLLSEQFSDFDPAGGGYTYVDNSGPAAESRLVRTGDLRDMYRQDATLGGAPLLPGEVASQQFLLRDDGSNDFFSYASMILPSNDFFIANGNPTAHDISTLLAEGGSISFFIGVPNGGVNDAGTEKETFRFSAGNPLFPGRNLPDGQSEANQGPAEGLPVLNVEGDAYEAFRNPFLDLYIRILEKRVSILKFLVDRYPFLSRPLGRTIAKFEAKLDVLRGFQVNVDGFNFNSYEGGVARVTITVGG